jgi:two-component system sensor histidine kinase KdpD
LFRRDDSRQVKFSIEGPKLWQSAKRSVLATLGLGLLTAVCFRNHLNFATASLLYLLVVVMQSLTADFASSALVSFVAVACLDYFFVPPLFSFNVADPYNILALFSFLITALVITRFATKAREEARASAHRHARLNALYKLSQQLLAMEPELAMGKKFLEPFRAAFDARAACLYDAGAGDLHLVGDSRNGLADRTREGYIVGRDMDDPASEVSIRCLRAGGRTTGAIGFEGLADAPSEAGALSALAATLVERTHGFRSASHATAAAQTEAYRSAILDALAHEFKNPLATILTAAGGIREAGPLRPEQQEMVEMVETETARLGHLTSRLLRVARLDREEVKPRMELIDVLSLIRGTVEQYSRLGTDRHVSLRDGCESAEVVADPELLRLAVSQLVDNACKYSQPGSSVCLSVERLPHFIAVRVSNTGSSILPHEENRIFERFGRGHEVGRVVPGSGLGLYVARKIALAHGGSLDLETDKPLNEGATFR